MIEKLHLEVIDIIPINQISGNAKSLEGNDKRNVIEHFIVGMEVIGQLQLLEMNHLPMIIHKHLKDDGFDINRINSIRGEEVLIERVEDIKELKQRFAIRRLKMVLILIIIIH